MSSQSAAPRLLRAVAETTQPYGPLLEGNAMHTLQEYLSDASQVDMVYLTVLNRASGEPLSLAVVDKCIALLKRYLPRYKASHLVLERAEDFCAQASASLTAMSPSMQKSLTYLQALVSRLMGNRSQRRPFKPSPRNQHQKSSSDTAVTMPASTISRAFSTPAPLLAHQKSKSSTRSASHRWSEQLSIAEDPPSNWAIHHNMLTARFGAGQSNAAICTRIAPFLPSLQQQPKAGEEEVWEDSRQGDPGASSSQEHVRTIAALQRLQASQANYSNDPSQDISRPKLRDNRPRLLFQYLPYIQQEALLLDPPDVEAVLEATCGSGGVFEGHSVHWGVEDTEELWKRETGRQGWGGAGGSQGDSAGQVCAAVLVKLVMDMYLKATPAVAFPLTLVMLHRALNSTVSTTRARPFDILYNLSLHAELLFSPARDSNQALPKSLDPDSVLEAAWAQAGHSGGWGLPEGLDPSLEAFRTWLRHLLWELTLLLVQREERSPEVWSAVLGCLTHLVTHCGHVVRAHLKGLSLKVVAALMQCCRQHRWCDTLYCHLIRLAVNQMYVPTNRPMDSEAKDDDPQGPAAPLQLSQEAVSDFGGIRQLIAHFKAASSHEARCNLLAVLLDLATLSQKEDGKGSYSSSLQQTLLERDTTHTGLSEALSQLTCNNVPEALQTAFQVADAGFATSIAHALQDRSTGNRHMANMQTGGTLDAPLESLLQQLEDMACTEASTSNPVSLQHAVQHTLACIRSAHQQPLEPLPDPQQAPSPGTRPRHQSTGSSSSVLVSGEEEPIALDEAWQCLAELLCEEDSWAGSVGQNWLYTLLTEAAEQHMTHTEDKQSYDSGQQYSDDDLAYPDSPGAVFQRGPHQVGLLPHPLGGPPKPDAPAHLTNQPELSQLLRTVLSCSNETVATGLRFIHVVKRLVLHLKLRCSVSAARQPQQHTQSVDHASRDVSSSSDVQRSSSQAKHKGSLHSKHASAEDLLDLRAEQGRSHVHRAGPEAASPSFTSDNSAFDDVLADVHPHLMRTSPALNWGKPSQRSRQASELQSIESDNGEPQRALSHHRTQSDPKGLVQAALSTAGSLAASGTDGERVPGQGIGAGPSGAASRAPSSVLQPSELTGFFQEGDKQDGAIVTHEGIVLHDAPVLGRKSPEQQAEAPAEGSQLDGPGQEAYRPKGNEGSPWQADKAAGMVLSTLYLALEWSLQAHPANRQPALHEIACLLLTFLCTPVVPAPNTSASPPLTPHLAPPSKVTIDIPANDPAHVTIRMPSPHGTAAPTPATTPRSAADKYWDTQAEVAAPSSLAWCFLTALAPVPEQVLQQVAPVLLVRLLHHLSPDSTATAGPAPADASNASQLLPQGQACQAAQDIRAALVLLLIARCNMEQTALQQAGGEALFAALLKDPDPRIRYHASMFVQQRLIATKADQYRRALRQLTQQAQQANDEKLLRNPYLQVTTMLDMRLIDLSV